MLPIVFDAHSRAALMAQLSARRSGEVMPTRWHEFLNIISREAVGAGPADVSWRAALTGRARLLSWQLSPETIATALAGRSFVYMCWGVPQRSAWKRGVLDMLLRRATHVLVNDTVTRDEVQTLTGRQSALVPFFIDTEFFALEPLTGRGDFVFCNGSNDRDPTFLLELAKHGLQIVWLVNDPQLRSIYDGLHPNLVVKSRISHVELRALYQTCAATIMPATRDAHAAGQTTGMEAIACGAPIVMTKGRTAGIFSDFPSVTAISSKSLLDWNAALMQLRGQPDLQQRANQARSRLQNRISWENMTALFNPVFGWPAKDMSEIQMQKISK
jgi:hypothetical protein